MDSTLNNPTGSAILGRAHAGLLVLDDDSTAAPSITGVEWSVPPGLRLHVDGRSVAALRA